MSATQTRSQTRTTTRFQYQSDRHYLRVQKDSPQWEGTLEDYLSKPSVAHPGEDMYRIESEDKKDTGDRRMVLLSCSKEDYDLHMKQVQTEAQGVQRAVEQNETVSGGVLTI